LSHTLSGAVTSGEISIPEHSQEQAPSPFCYQRLPSPMIDKIIQGHESVGYMTLGRTMVTERGIATLPRGRQWRSAQGTHGSHVSPGRSGDSTAREIGAMPSAVPAGTPRYGGYSEGRAATSREGEAFSSLAPRARCGALLQCFYAMCSIFAPRSFRCFRPLLA